MPTQQQPPIAKACAVVLALVAFIVTAEGIRSSDTRTTTPFSIVKKKQRIAEQFYDNAEYEEQLRGYHSLHRPGDNGVCHNATGACLPGGIYQCMNGDRVRYADRCDGVEDCGDGTDEFMCNLHPTHVSELPEDSVHRREYDAQFATATCNGCACPAGEPSNVGIGNPYFPMALHAKMTPEFSDEPPKGQRCNAAEVIAIRIQLYKKSVFCRKAVCCIRQVACVRCNTTDVTPRPGKCYFKSNVTASPEETKPPHA